MGLGKENGQIATHLKILAALAGAGQAAGSVTAKMGLYGDFPALSGQIMRVGIGMVVMWLLTFIGGKARATVQALVDQPKAFQHILIASFLGPFLGVFFSLVAAFVFTPWFAMKVRPKLAALEAAERLQGRAEEPTDSG